MSFGFTLVALKIHTVYDVNGNSLGDDDFSCSSSLYSTKSDCETPGICSNAVYTTPSTCEAASETWTQTNTWSASGKVDIYIENQTAGCSLCRTPDTAHA